MEADWWVAVYAAGGEQEPDVVFIIAASDMKAMKAALGEEVKFSEYGKLAVYTTDADAFTKTTARIKGEGQNRSRRWPAKTASRCSTGAMSRSSSTSRNWRRRTRPRSTNSKRMRRI